MRFYHIADVHIGAWREPRLAVTGIESFKFVVDEAIKTKADFLLIAGDLFDTALPAIDYIKITAKILSQLKEAEIPVYLIPGSHDYSPSGKTMLDVLEIAGLITNVVKAGISDEGKIQLQYTVDKKTNAHITGMLGKKNALETSYYENLDTEHLSSLTTLSDFKIFMFHSAIDELKPSELSKMESSPLSLLPPGFNYYAGGHVHIINKIDLPNYSNVIYPGPVFPCSFDELDKLEKGSYYVYDDSVNSSSSSDSNSSEPFISLHTIDLHPVVKICFDATGLSPEQVHVRLIAEIEKRQQKNEFTNAIVLLKIYGNLNSGKVFDIPFNVIIAKIESLGAYIVLKHTSKLLSQEMKAAQLSVHDLPSETEIIAEHVGQINLPKSLVGSSNDAQILKTSESKLMSQLIMHLSKEKSDGETVTNFEKRIIDDIEFLKNN